MNPSSIVPGPLPVIVDLMDPNSTPYSLVIPMGSANRAMVEVRPVLGAFGSAAYDVYSTTDGVVGGTKSSLGQLTSAETVKSFVNPGGDLVIVLTTKTGSAGVHQIIVTRVAVLTSVTT